jgi:hypothetical protein
VFVRTFSRFGSILGRIAQLSQQLCAAPFAKSYVVQEREPESYQPLAFEFPQSSVVSPIDHAVPVNTAWAV